MQDPCCGQERATLLHRSFLGACTIPLPHPVRPTHQRRIQYFNTPKMIQLFPFWMPPRMPAWKSKKKRCIHHISQVSVCLSWIGEFEIRLHYVSWWDAYLQIASFLHHFEQYMIFVDYIGFRIAAQSFIDEGSIRSKVHGHKYPIVIYCDSFDYYQYLPQLKLYNNSFEHFQLKYILPNFLNINEWIWASAP